jgi:3-hydroxyisobutyrate dehydrogenase-like beta-hydroxyacid dehydrogenase
VRVTVFGLGEAGSRFAADLTAAGIDVHAYDPAPVTTPVGVKRHDEPTMAVSETTMILALTAAADAASALAQAIDHIAPATLYADLSTGSAGLKQQLAATAEEHGLLFADVALMSIVVAHGLRTPALVSGPGADRYAELLGGLGAPVEAIGDEAGLAATRKLLRSVVIKGLAALLTEAMRAGEASGQGDWLWGNLVDELSAPGAAFLARLVHGTKPHALRRFHEMEASASLLTELGVDPVMTRSTIESLRRISEDGLPPLPTVVG